MSNNNVEALLNELLAQVNRIHERLDVMNNVPISQHRLPVVNCSNEVRVGRGANQSKHDMVKLLKSYVSSEYDLVSLRTRNDIIWERLKAVDLSKLTDTDARIYRSGLNAIDIPTYKIVTSRWYITLTPISSNVNVLFNKFRKMEVDNVDDLRAIAQVVRTITKIVNS